MDDDRTIEGRSGEGSSDRAVPTPTLMELAAFVDEHLPHRRHVEIEKYLETDPDSREAVEAIRSLRRLYSDHTDFDAHGVSPELMQSAQTLQEVLGPATGQPAEPAVVTRPMRILGHPGSIAAMLIVSVVGFLVGQRSSTQLAPGPGSPDLVREMSFGLVDASGSSSDSFLSWNLLNREDRPWAGSDDADTGVVHRVQRGLCRGFFQPLADARR